MSSNLRARVIRSGPGRFFKLRPRGPNWSPISWSPSSSKNFSTGHIPESEAINVDIATFKRDAFDVQTPLVLRANSATKSPTYEAGIRALLDAYSSRDGPPTTINLPYEIVGTTTQIKASLFRLREHRQQSQRQRQLVENDDDPFLDRLQISKIDNLLSSTPFKSLDQFIQKTPENQIQFLRFTAPLELFKWFHKCIRYDFETTSILESIYIAQADLDSIFPNQIPVPDHVKHAGKGDIYKSSLWMGLEPTHTPWHVDPNPNYFFQLVSSKTVRLLPPNRGQALFDKAMATIPPEDQSSARIRGEEMFSQSQRAALTDAVWGSGAPEGILETVLEPGDALFIPQGWWHSLNSGSIDTRPRLNVSLNWWFR